MQHDFVPKDILRFVLTGDCIAIHIQDDTKQFAWQLEVNGSKSEPTIFYQGILAHEGYFVATAYWEGVFPVFIPFRIIPAIKVTKNAPA